MAWVVNEAQERIYLATQEEEKRNAYLDEIIKKSNTLNKWL